MYHAFCEASVNRRRGQSIPPIVATHTARASLLGIVSLGAFAVVSKAKALPFLLPFGFFMLFFVVPHDAMSDIVIASVKLKKAESLFII